MSAETEHMCIHGWRATDCPYPAGTGPDLLAQPNGCRPRHSSKPEEPPPIGDELIGAPTPMPYPPAQVQP